MRIILLFINCFLVFLLLPAQEPDTTYMFRLLLKDKGESIYSIHEPEKFLSPSSIARRSKQGIAVDETDLPLSPSYLTEITSLGVEIVAKSKWLQTVTIKTQDATDSTKLTALPYVDSLLLVYKGPLTPMEEDTLPSSPLLVTSNQTYQDIYGAGFGQIAMHNGNLLHEAGFRGEGISIAVFDGGFHNADKIEAFDPDRIVDVKKFNHLQAHPYRIKAEHGTRVLSCMLANKENLMVGTAPDASYYLFCTEVDNSEFPVEEDYWITALEYADSIGVDITTTSLGYTEFDLPERNHRKTDLDGESVLMSRAATMAADKGIFVLNAAGNEGNRVWNTISFPSDAKRTLTVGAVNLQGEAAVFTPTGPTVDGRIKPDVVGTGESTSLIASDGRVVNSNGTSYSTPVIAGLAACLWQALPKLSNLELLELIQAFSDRYTAPDHQYGYGIPDVFKAYETGSSSLNTTPKPVQSLLIRHIGTYLYVDIPAGEVAGCKLTLYNTVGKIVEMTSSLPHATFSVGHLPFGMYIALLEGNGIHQACKFIVR